MSRRHPSVELYDERDQERDYYYRGRGGGSISGARRNVREFEEADVVDIDRNRQPDFFRDPRSGTAQLVVRERVEEVERVASSPRPRPRDIERDEVFVRERDRSRPRVRDRSVEREEVVIRRGDRDRHRRDMETEEIDINIRRDESDRRSMRSSRVTESERDQLPAHSTRSGKSTRIREVERESVSIRGPPGGREVRRGDEVEEEKKEEEEEVIVRSKTRQRDPRLPPRENLVAREKEEIVIRRRKPRSPSSSRSRSPPRRREVEKKEEIIIRRTERSPSPVSTRMDQEAERGFQPIIRPPIHQEIVTHHRHIDHGVTRARSLSPPSRSPSPPEIESLEIDIRKRSNGKEFDENITIEQTRGNKGHGNEVITRERSHSASNRDHRNYDNYEDEADYYTRRALDRGYPGEAYNGATKDWAIVDVPPGTERVRMDGLGGGSQEITWQRYNGVRRSKFLAGEREYDSAIGFPERRHENLQVALAPSRTRPDLWTEVTKDLVTKEAIEAMGYDYEETEFFFYIMEYLRYDDVLRLVEVSDDIRRNRRRRLREIEFEREELHEHHGHVDERIVEREVILDRRRH